MIRKMVKSFFLFLLFFATKGKIIKKTPCIIYTVATGKDDGASANQHFVFTYAFQFSSLTPIGGFGIG